MSAESLQLENVLKVHLSKKFEEINEYRIIEKGEKIENCETVWNRPKSLPVFFYGKFSVVLRISIQVI